MAGQEKGAKLPFTEEEMDKFGISVETRGFSQFTFKHTLNLDEAILEEPAVKSLVDRCNLRTYVEKVGQAVDYSMCAEFLRSFDKNRNSGTVTVRIGEQERRVEVPLDAAIIEKALGLAPKRERHPKRDVYTMMGVRKDDVHTVDGISLADIPNPDLKLQAKMVHTIFSGQRYNALMNRIGVPLLESIVAGTPEEVDWNGFVQKTIASSAALLTPAAAPAGGESPASTARSSRKKPASKASTIR